MTLRPDLPHAGRCLDTLTDKELSRFEQATVPVKAGYIPSFPERLLQAVNDADAVIALPLILAIHRQLVMTRGKETPLTKAIWKCAGSPSPKRRETILRTLKAIPHVILVTPARTAITHYRVAKGELWELK